MTKFVKCKTCQKEFKTQRGKYCCKECRPKINKVCIICNKSFVAVRKNGDVCSDECRRRNDEIKRSKILQEKENILQCKICSLYIGKSLVHHIRNIHNISIDEYKIKYEVDEKSIYANSTRQKLSKSISGEKNIWFNHGGRMSPFSKNNDKISEEERKNNQERAIISRSENGNNTTSLEYF